MTTSLVIHPDGDIVEVNPRPGADHLALMREHLACCAVDCVALTDRIDMWIDDEGLYTKPVDRPATALARRYGFTWQDYHGPVLLCGVDDHGDSVDLTRDEVVGLLTHLADVVDNV